MKKIVACILAVCMLVSGMSVFAANTEILINGEKATIQEGMGSIVEKDWRTFVPVRFALEYFGYQVSWVEKDRMVFGVNENGSMFVMQVGSNFLFFKDKDNNEKKVEMDVSPFLNNEEGRTYIPLRFLADVLGYQVGYDEATSTVTLDK